MIKYLENKNLTTRLPSVITPEVSRPLLDFPLFFIIIFSKIFFHLSVKISKTMIEM